MGLCTRFTDFHGYGRAGSGHDFVNYGWSGWVGSGLKFYRYLLSSAAKFMRLAYSDPNLPIAMSYLKCLISLFTMHSSRACHIYKTSHLLNRNLTTRKMIILYFENSISSVIVSWLGHRKYVQIQMDL